jgi:hypothetical protein
MPLLHGPDRIASFSNFTSEVWKGLVPGIGEQALPDVALVSDTAHVAVDLLMRVVNLLLLMGRCCCLATTRSPFHRPWA